MATNPSAFEKDLGYLMPFLDRVAAAASGLPDPAAREELARLMSEEKARWQRIQALLQGAQGAAAGGPAEASRRDEPVLVGLTVGNLRGTPVEKLRR
ncbi:hypothetical protein LZ198_01705 [Myxococcus sp. K15C18031901]|uniref:hypothetical protein n=1 Tax=Myxococcus dinghuensis TaxID=2906761 RepID=UPI0020A825D4|nr:hypothetical protein [Myxococcus dinghuensis]MCP3097585.1 hypothetical protein [Myxococcus dinghuensis]